MSIPKDIAKSLSVLERNIGYQFSDRQLLMTAITHSSYGDGHLQIENYERLEFLGDRVLGLLTAQHLYETDLGDEGSMARRLNALVRKETCARVGRRFDLGDAILMSRSEIRQGGRDKTSILGDACEAVMAALYLDGGLPAASAFFDRFWRSEIQRVKLATMKDPKTSLQERASAAGFELPQYEVVERDGPDHRPLFVIEVTVAGKGSARGTGKSKKDAERFAARHLMEIWNDLPAASQSS